MKKRFLEAVCLAVSLLASSVALVAADILPNKPNPIAFPAQQTRFVRFIIQASSSGQPCIDELEIYGSESTRNIALASTGAKATASSCLAGHAIHKVEHLNDGLYGNAHSWIAASPGEEWVQIELPRPTAVSKVVFSRDREGRFTDRVPIKFEVRVSLDGHQWQTISRVTATAALSKPRVAPYVAPAPLPDPVTWDGLLRYAFLCERETWRRVDTNDHLSPLLAERPALPQGAPYWGQIARLDPTIRVLTQMEEMIERLAAKGVDVAGERKELTELRQRQTAKPDDALYLDARMAKRRLMLRDPDLAALQKILFVKRHPYLSSHNYSDVLDSKFQSGGGVCMLEIPRHDGRLDPAEAKLTTLFDASAGIARDAMADFEARTIYFAYRADKAQPGSEDRYWHLMAMDTEGDHVRQLTDGPFHDYYPCPLPDGGLVFISTRCKARFLCWRPQAFVLFRMDRSGKQIEPLSFANLSEWAPALMRDGRILWTRSEYIDKGADFGHTLWAIRPDGTHPELIFGNNTPNCYINGREVPGTREILCTLFSHGGDHNGPLGLVDLAKARGPSDTEAITNITPDTTPRYNMNWPRQECWRDPVPVSRDYFLASHAPADRFGLYVADRYGNREMLYLDPAIGSMCPTPLRPTPRPPVIACSERQNTNTGELVLEDIYAGLEPAVKRGTVKYLRVCQEVRADLDRLDNGEYRRDHPSFLDWYATPINKVNGPFGWPSYVAKAALGLVPVASDGSARFIVPAGKVVYFEALDEHFNELQRMRSVVQLQPGERRSCVGCHEHRSTAGMVRPSLALRRPACVPEPPSWGAVPFAYEKVVQPVWNAHCVSCHDANDKQKLNLTDTLDADRVPASYRTLITQGLVHYFDMTWKLRHNKADPMSFGTLQSKLWKVLDAGHHGVSLTQDEVLRVKCWIDLNCPLWPDYINRQLRPRTAKVD